MRLLLDTHALLWWLEGDPALNAEAHTAITDPANNVFVSIASAWEIALKIGTGKLRFPLEKFEHELATNQFELLPIHIPHILHIAKLPKHHRDPFDRMLLAQAISEGLVIVTRDGHFPKYAAQTMMA